MGEDGITLRSKLEQVERTTGKRPAALDHEELPQAAYDAYDLWIDIHRGRSYGMGITPLTWIELDAWERVRNRKLSYTELELIRVIDDAFVNRSQESRKPKEENAGGEDAGSNTGNGS